MRLFLFLIFIGLSANAQEFGKSLSVPAGSGIIKPSTTLPSSTISPSSSAKLPSSIFDSPKSSGTLPATEINSNFGKTSEFANPNDNYTKKFDRIELSVIPEERRKYIGDIRAHSGSVRLYYRDDGSIDGDMVRIYINGEVVKESLLLDGEYKGFTISLKDGMNKIDFEALNEGSSSPNTAEFEIFDANGVKIHHSNWALPTGYVATVIVNK